MAFDLGSLFGGGNFDAQQARMLAGQGPNPAPNPNPQAAPGGAPGPQGASGGATTAPGGGQPNLAAAAPGQTPSQTYAPDPQNGQLTNQMLLKAYQHDQFMNSLSYDLRRVGASFGTAEQQRSSMAALGNPPQEDTLGAFGKMEEIQKAQQDLSDRARYRAGAAGIAGMLGITPEQAMNLRPEMLDELLKSHLLVSSPTDHGKDIEAGSKAYAQSKGYDPDPSKWTLEQQQDVANWKATTYQNTVGGLDPGAKAFNEGWLIARRQNPGKSDAEILAAHPELENPITYGGAKAEEGRLQTEKGADLAEAIKSTPALTQKIDETSRLVNDIKNNPKLDAALTWFSTPGHNILSAEAQNRSGMMDDDTYRAISYINQLGGAVYGQAFSSAGSKRTQQEVAAIVSGLSQVKSTGYSKDEYIKNALDPLQEQLNIGKANALGAAQQLDEIPTELRGYVNKTYLPGGKTYSGKGGSWANDVELTPQEQQQAQALIDKGESREKVRRWILQQGKRPPMGW